MRKAQIVPLFGFGTKGKSPVITAQRRLNLYIEPYQGDEVDKSSIVIIGRPGLSRLTLANNSNANALNGPVRTIGEQVVFSNAGQTQQAITPMFGNTVYLYQTGGGLTVAIGPQGVAGPGIRTTSGLCQSIYNGVQQLIVDGRTGYVLNWGTLLLTVLEDGASFFPAGATTACFIAGRAVVDDPSSLGRFRWSGVYDFTQWASLDFATAEASADSLISVLEAGGELQLFGRDTIEFWLPTGDTRVFARINGATQDYGLAAKQSLAKIGGGVMFLGRSRAGGERQVFFVRAHQVQEMTSADVVADINLSADPDAATGLSFVIGGHPFYQLNLPETTWIYDFKAGQWDEWQTDGGRHAVDRAIAAFGVVIGGDYRDGRMYKYDVTANTDDGNVLPAELTTKHVLDNYERLSVAELVVDIETGTATIPGTYEGAIVLNGAALAGATTAAPSTASFSMELWFNETATSASNQVLVNKQVAAGLAPRLYIDDTGGRLVFDNNSTGLVSTSWASGLNAWHHFAGVYDSVAATAYLYLDGVLMNSAAGIADMGGANAASGFRIGSQDGAVNKFAGEIADVRVWSTVRSQLQIARNMNSILTGTEAGLVALWNNFPNQQLTVLDLVSGKTLTMGASVGWDSRQITAPRTPQVMLSWSSDGGRTWGNEVWVSAGNVGEYMVRAVWRMLGRARDKVFKIRITDPITRKIINAAMRVG